jgi:hypothetical protein
MTVKRPIVLWFIVVLVLLTCGVLMWFIQNQAHDSRQSSAAVGPVNDGATSAGVVDVTILRDAIAKGDRERLKAEITGKNLDLNAPMQLGDGPRPQMTMLAFATIQGSAVGVQELIALGAEPDVADSFGITPLMLAAERSDADITILLLNAGAKAELKDNDGRRAIDWAQQHHNDAGQRVVDILTKAKK